MARPIRFLVPWRNFAVGDIDDRIHPGIRETLVRRGIAVWVEPAAAPPKSEEAEPAPKKGKRRD